MKTFRILVVEDEGVIAHDIKATLEKLGYEVPAIAVTGEEAVEMATDFAPDLVLMDIVLRDGMGGVEAAALIQEHLRLPVIFLTAHTDQATLQRAKFTCPYGYIVKPLVERDLRIGIEMALHKHAMERQVAKQDHWYATTLANLGEAVIATDPQGQVRFLNALAESITGWSQIDALGRPLDEVMAFAPEATPADSHGPFAEAVRKGQVINWNGDTRLWARGGPDTPIDYTATCIHEPDGSLAGVVVVFRDITPRRQTEEGRERLIRQLRATLETVKALRGSLPVCASCKKIRDTAGHWEPVDVFVTRHGMGEVSHGICPDCIRSLYPSVADEILSAIAHKQDQTAPPPGVQPSVEWIPRLPGDH